MLFISLRGVNYPNLHPWGEGVDIFFKGGGGGGGVDAKERASRF